MMNKVTAKLEALAVKERERKKVCNKHLTTPHSHPRV
jgi:hypothetical protein